MPKTGRVNSRRIWSCIAIAAVLVTGAALAWRVLASYAWSNAGMVVVARLVLADAPSEAGQAESAESDLRRAAHLEAGNLSAARGLGWALWLQDRRAEGGAEWSRSGLRAADFVLAGRRAWSAVSSKEALGWFERAMAIEPNMGDAYYYAGLLHQTDRDLDGALLLFDTALSRTTFDDPDVPPRAQAHRDEVASILWRREMEDGERERNRGGYAEALTHYDRAMALYPERADAYYGAALAREAMGSLEEALGLFDGALSASEADDPGVWAEAQAHREAIAATLWAQNLETAKAALEVQDYETALQRALKATVLNPKSGDAFCYAAFAQESLGEHDEALALLDQGLAQPSFSDETIRIEGHFLRGDLLRRAERFSEAIPDYEAVVARRTRNYWAHLWLGVSWWKAYQNAEEAETYLLKAIAINPNVKTAFRWLGIVYQIEGRKPEAVQMYQRVLEIDPEDEWSKEQLEVMRKWVQ